MGLEEISSKEELFSDGKKPSYNYKLRQDKGGGYSPKKEGLGNGGFPFYIGLVGLALLSREDMTSIGCILSVGALSVFIIDVYYTYVKS